MEQERDSKEFAWKWVTADEILSKTACDFCCIMLTATTDVGYCYLYDGENAQGTLIGRIECLANRSVMFVPHHPVYCRRGLYLDIVSNLFGCFVMWRPRASKEG